MWPTCSRIMSTSTAKMAKLPFSSHRVILHRSNRLETGSSPMARVGANLLCVVIYGPFRSCYLDPGQNNQDPGNGGNVGYKLIYQWYENFPRTTTIIHNAPIRVRLNRIRITSLFHFITNIYRYTSKGGETKSVESCFR